MDRFRCAFDVSLTTARSFALFLPTIFARPSHLRSEIDNEIKNGIAVAKLQLQADKARELERMQTENRTAETANAAARAAAAAATANDDNDATASDEEEAATTTV